MASIFTLPCATSDGPDHLPDKLSALRSLFLDHGMLDGTALQYVAMEQRGEAPVPRFKNPTDNDTDFEDIGPATGPKTTSSISLSSTTGALIFILVIFQFSDPYRT